MVTSNPFDRLTMFTFDAERDDCTTDSHEPAVPPSEPEMIEGISASTPSLKMSSYRLRVS